MNCFNGEEFLNESINSVINQTYKNWKSFFGIINQQIIVQKFYKDLKIKELNIFIRVSILHLVKPGI